MQLTQLLDSELSAAARLAIAGLIGIGVGLEREWSGHTTGPDARFAGLRTFFLLGILGGSAGVLAARGFQGLAIAIAVGSGLLAVSAYVVAARKEGAHADGTTEAAALAVVALAALAGLGWLTLAAGAGSVMVLALSEKNRLHGLVRHLGETELHAALQFAVLAVVILPLIPTGPMFGALAIRPRMLWTMVLLFSALNFAGYIARRAVAAQAGYGITGALGGVVSSTAVTLNFSRHSHSEPALGIPLARGVIAACTVLVPRVLVVSALLSPAVAVALLPYLLPSLAIGAGIVMLAWRRDAGSSTQGADERKSPLRLRNALEMTVLFQIALTAITYVRAWFGTTGLYGTAALLGLTDVDALTVSMSSPSSLLDPAMAARALAVGVLANTMLKTGVVVTIGRGPFRRSAAVGLLCLAGVTVAALIFF